jgi:small subunit ribosomal protein S8
MDPIANMLVMIKNASRAGNATVAFPHSKIKLEIANTLVRSGFIKSVSKKAKKVGETIEVELLYKDSTPRIDDVMRVSKVSRRTYMGVNDLKPIKNGRGIMVLSTPKGILTDKEAKKEHVGGEVILSIW